MKLHAYSFFFIAAAAGSVIFATLLFFFAPPQIPLWYSLSIVEQQLDAKILVFIFPTLITIIALIHSFFMRKVRTLDLYLHSLFFYATFVPIVILYIALIRIAMVVL
ncbi:MAG: hypothetical protein ABI758_03775 [Candidatus Woesebacteria bacterium]